MTNKEKVIELYNDLIKLKIDTMLIWKKGNSSSKNQGIEECKSGIKFYKNQKRRVINGEFDHL
jgi:hypothetical protein